jgi:glutaredoxin
MSVVVYTKNFCPGCMSVKAWLDGNGVAYEVRNTNDADREKAEKFHQEVTDIGAMSFPVVIVGDNSPVVGPDIETIEKQLGL